MNGATSHAHSPSGPSVAIWIKSGLSFLDTTSHRARPRYSDAHLRIGRKGYRAKFVRG